MFWSLFRVSRSVSNEMQISYPVGFHIVYITCLLIFKISQEWYQDDCKSPLLLNFKLILF